MRWLRRSPWTIAAVVASLFCAAPSQAQRRTIPVAAATIYPGETIRDSMLRDAEMRDDDAVEALPSRAEIIGRLARRTLLAGRPIFPDYVAEPRAVQNGATVQLVYTEPGVVITATGQALQPGQIGEVIRVRNMESGLVVSGAIGRDGSVRIAR